MKAVDLFAGAGGWTTGATQAGVQVVAAVNHWPRAVETHALNHPEVMHRCQDVALMDPRDLPAHELLIASPACTGHTRARGKERPHHDASRATAWAVVDVAEVTRPRLILVENVPEFLAWRLFPAWERALALLGYHLSTQVLDAADFGVPQHRRRLFIVGKLGRHAPRIVSPGLPHVPARAIIDWQDGQWRPIDGPSGRGCERSPKVLRQIEQGRRDFGSRFLVPYFSTNRTGRSLERPLGTLTTKDRYGLVDGERMRMLTVAEQRRGMGFPATYILRGTYQEQVKQLGNAVPPPLACGVARQALEAA